MIYLPLYYDRFYSFPKDPEIFKEILGWRGRKTPITAVVANLANPKDAGTKKAIAHILRHLRQARE